MQALQRPASQTAQQLEHAFLAQFLVALLVIVQTKLYLQDVLVFGSAVKDCEFFRTPKVFVLDKPDAKCGYQDVEQAQRFTMGQRRFFQKPVRQKRSVRIILRLDEMTPVTRRIINHGQLSEAMTPRIESPSKLPRYETGNIGMAVASERNGNFEFSK